MLSTSWKRVWISTALCLSATVGLIAPAQAQQGTAPANLPPVDAAPAPPPAAPPRASTLEECIALAMSRQPALRAAQASYEASLSTQRGLDSLGIGARVLATDLHVRKKQACLGVSIAAAGIRQAEAETRYAVTRCYWTVQYAHQQRGVVDSVIDKLKYSYDKGKIIVDAGDPNSKVTKLDLDTLQLNMELARAKRVEAEIGMTKATAALREAIGLGLGEELAVPVDPLPTVVPTNIDKDALINYALANRPEIAQVALVKNVTDLEISAQHWSFAPTARTYAAGTDIHAKPIPQGHDNGDYRPGAIGPEMPTMMAGRRPERVARAANFADRAQAVVEKTTNLVALDVEAAYLKWKQAADQIVLLEKAPENAGSIAKKVQNRFDSGNVTGEELLRARTLEDYARSQYTEALFNHVIGLAALERATAGGYRAPR